MVPMIVLDFPNVVRGNTNVFWYYNDDLGLQFDSIQWVVIHEQIRANCLKSFLSGLKTNLASFRSIWGCRSHFQAYFDIFLRKKWFFRKFTFLADFLCKFCTILKGLLRASEGVPRGSSEKFFKLNFTRYHIEKTIGGIPNKHVWAPRSQIS